MPSHRCFDLRYGLLIEASVYNPLPLNATYRWGHKRNADAGCDQANNGVNLQRFLHHVRGEAGLLADAHELVIVTRRIAAREKDERLIRQKLGRDRWQAGEAMVRG